MTAIDTDATRRGLLALGGLALGVGALASTPVQAARGFADPVERLRAYMMMRGALDDRLIVGCISGRYYGVVDNELTPMYGVVGATFSRYRALPGGGYQGASYEVPYFTDLATGEVIDTWRNPYTNQDVTVTHGGYPPSVMTIGADLTLSLPKPPPGLAMQHRVLPAQVIGDDVWMTEETMSALTIPGLPKPIRYSELVILHSRVSDFADPKAMRAPCQTAYTSIVSWRPWLKMGDHPGHLIGNGTGRYDVPMDDLPPAWLRAAKVRRPDVLMDPGAALAAL